MAPERVSLPSERELSFIQLDPRRRRDRTIAVPSKNVFITGATGYLGRPLVGRLLERGHHVRALVRPDSRGKLPPW